MPVTSPDGLRYPSGNDSPAGHTQMQNLANDTQAALTNIRTALNAGDAVPLIRLALQSNFSVPSNNLNIVVPFGAGSEVFKTHASMHSVSTNNTRVIVPQPGYYRCTFHPGWAANSTGYRAWQIGKNSVRLFPEMKTSWTLLNVQFAGPAVYQTVRCQNAGDYLEAFIFQQSGVSVDIIGGNGDASQSTFEVEYVRPL